MIFALNARLTPRFQTDDLVRHLYHVHPLLQRIQGTGTRPLDAPLRIQTEPIRGVLWRLLDTFHLLLLRVDRLSQGQMGSRNVCHQLLPAHLVPDSVLRREVFQQGTHEERARHGFHHGSEGSRR